MDTSTVRTDGAPEPPRGRLRALLRDPGVRLPLLLGGFIMGLLTLERALLLIVLSDRFAGIAAGDLARAFIVGWRFDLAITCTALLPLVLMFALVNTTTLRWAGTRRLLSAYCGAVMAFVVLAGIVDFAFFVEYDERMDYKVLYYTSSIHTAKMLWEEYPMIPVVLAGFVALWFAARLFGRALRTASVERRWTRAVGWTLLLVPLLALGVRSSVGPKRINSGTAHFSPSLLLAQLTLNGLFTLQEAVDSKFLRHLDLAQFVELLPEREAFARSVATLSRPEDRPVENAANPLRRITNTGRPRVDYNVVIVLMESHSWHFIGEMGGDASLSPNLDALIREGVLADYCFAVGSRTPYGLCGTICGFPDLPGASVTTRNETEGRFLTLARILAERGYETLFLNGGPPTFDHMRSFLHGNGFQRLLFEDEFEHRSFRTHLGWCDGDLYDQLHDEILKVEEGRPFLATVLTQSFHRPYDVPEGSVEPVDPSVRKAKMLTSARYADHALGQFFEKARRADYFDDTIFVVVADHTGGNRGKILSAVNFRIPFLLYAPKILGTQGRRIETVCSQTDISPTILSLLGGEYEHCFFGSSILDRPPETGFALLQRNSKALALMDADRDFVLVPFRGGETQLLHFELPDRVEPLDLSVPENAAKRDLLEEQGIALLQTAQEVFLRGAHQLHEPLPGQQGGRPAGQ